MTVGSLVVYVYNGVYVDMLTPDASQIYTVRETIMCQNFHNRKPHLGIRLEEIINGTVAYGFGDGGHELAYQADHFKEVQPPMTINLEELLLIPEEIL